MSFPVSLSSQSDSASIFLSLSTSLFPSLLIEFFLGQSLCLSLIFPSVQCSTEWHWDNPDVGDKLSHMKLVGRLPWLWGCWSCVPRQHCKELRHKCARLWSSHLNAINSACFCAGTLGFISSWRHPLFQIQWVLSALLSCEIAPNSHFSVWSATDTSQVKRKGSSEIDFFLDTMILFTWTHSSCG